MNGRENDDVCECGSIGENRIVILTRKGDIDVVCNNCGKSVYDEYDVMYAEHYCHTFTDDHSCKICEYIKQVEADAREPDIETWEQYLE